MKMCLRAVSQLQPVNLLLVCFSLFFLRVLELHPLWCHKPPTLFFFFFPFAEFLDNELLKDAPPNSNTENNTPQNSVIRYHWLNRSIGLGWKRPAKHTLTHPALREHSWLLLVKGRAVSHVHTETGELFTALWSQHLNQCSEKWCCDISEYCQNFQMVSCWMSVTSQVKRHTCMSECTVMLSFDTVSKSNQLHVSELVFWTGMFLNLQVNIEVTCSCRRNKKIKQIN